MKTSVLARWINRTIFFLMVQFFSVLAIAQDGGDGLDVDVDVNKDGGTWYTSPWIWVGVAAFIIILVLAMRGGKKE